MLVSRQSLETFELIDQGRAPKIYAIVKAEKRSGSAKFRLQLNVQYKRPLFPNAVIRHLPYSGSGFILRNNYLESFCGITAGVFQPPNSDSGLFPLISRLATDCGAFVEGPARHLQFQLVSQQVNGPGGKVHVRLAGT